MNSFLSLGGSQPRSTFRSETSTLRRLLLRSAISLALAPAGELLAQFGPPTIYFSGGTMPLALASGTMGVGNPDLVVASAAPFGVTNAFEHYGNGGQPSCPLLLAPVKSPLLGLGDFGAQDIAVAEIAALPLFEEVVALEVTGFALTRQLQVYSGTTAIGLPVPTTPGAVQMLVRDFDGDGFADVVVLDTTGNLVIHQNSGGTLGPAAVALPPGGPGLGGAAVGFVAGSFDGDPLPDLAVLWSGGQVRLLRNTSTLGSISFGATLGIGLFPGATWVAGPGLASMTAADFDGDGCDDIAVAGASPGNGDIWVVRTGRTAAGWPGTVTIAPPVKIPNALGGGFLPGAITSGDFDLDGDIDLAYAATDGTVRIRYNEGAGAFPNPSPGFEEIHAASCVALVACDLDADGDLDLAGCDYMATGPVVTFCNDTDPGRCHHVLRAGIDDAFVVWPTPGQPAVERTCPRAALGALPRTFDVTPSFFPLGHTFESLPGRIVSAKLYIGLGPDFANGNIGDLISFDWGPNGPEKDFAFTTPVTVNTGVAEVCFDLSELSSGLNLLPRLQKARRLDVTVSNRTKVDYLRLVLVTACEDHSLALRYDANLGANSYYHDPLVGGNLVSFSIDAGGGLFASGIGVVLLSTGIDNFPFPSLCIPDVTAMWLMLLDTQGRGSMNLALPVGLPPRLLANTQAVAVDPTIDLATAKWSHTITDYIH